ncbi:MAG TPA: hypothetical protein PK987_02265 [Ferruginibacter sp.]|nr:hypothetical protein [Ferruginibacter sp.]
MKNTAPQNELLLMVHSNFFSQQLEKLSCTETQGWFSQKEQLKDACWNGLASEILPECFNSSIANTTPLHQINDANLFIDLQFSTNNTVKEKRYSLNPYVFMQMQELN